MPVTLQPTTLKYRNHDSKTWQEVSAIQGFGVPPGGTQGQVLAKVNSTSYDTEWVTPNVSVVVETITGSTPNIIAEADHQYICGECSELTITTPSSGIIDVIFESGSTPTELTVVPPTGMTMKWQEWFDPANLEANRIYEINILNGIYGVVISWG